MKRGVGFIAAWVGATLLAVVIAAAAVGSVRSGVTNEPTALGSPSAAAIATGLPDGSSQTTDVDSTTTTSLESEPPTTASSSITTTTIDDSVEATPSSTTTTTTTAGSTSTTTTAAAPTTTAASQFSKTVDTVGGSVTIVVDGASVSFGGAVPRTGWKVELEKAGPDEVKVKFEKNDDSAEVEVKASIEDGELVVNVSSDDD